MIQYNKKQQNNKLQCKKHDQKQITLWCCQPDCKDEKVFCFECIKENNHSSHLNNVFEIDQLIPYFADQQKKTYQLKQLAQDSSDEFSKFINQMMDGIEYKFYRFDPKNIRSQEQISNAIKFSFQIENLQQNIKEHFFNKLKEIQEQFEQFNNANELNIWDDENYCKLGGSLLKQNCLDEAKEFYQKSLQIKKTNLNAKIGIAQCLQKSHNYIQALELYKEMQTVDNNNYQISLQIAECLRNMWQNEEAFDAYSKALEIKKTTYGFFMQGLILYNLEREDEIIKFYKLAKELGVKDEWMKLFKILRLLIDNKIVQAKGLINQIGKDSDEQVDFWISVFKMLLSQEDKEESLKFAEQILKIEPNNFQTLRIKVSILIKQNEYEQVIILFDQIEKINGKHKFIQDFREQLYSQLLNLDYDEKMDIYELILQFNPKSITTLKLKCKCLINNDKLTLALFTLEQILKLDLNEEILELKEMIQKKLSSEFQNNHKKLHDFYTKCLKVNPSNVTMLEFMYLHLIEQEDYGEAIKIIQQNLQFEPNNFQHQFNLCKCLIQLDNIQEAINVFNQIIEINTTTEKALEQKKELFSEIVNLSSKNDNRKFIKKQLKKNHNNFVVQILECVLILNNQEEENKTRQWLFEFIDNIFDANYQNKLKLIQNFLDDDSEEFIRERVNIMKAIKELFFIIKNKEQNHLIKVIKKKIFQIIKEKLVDSEQLSFCSYIIQKQPDNLIALEFKTRILHEKQIEQDQQEYTNEILENIEIILNQNPNIHSLLKIKCKYLLKQNKFIEAIELVNSILQKENDILKFKIFKREKNILSTLIKMIEEYFNEFDQESKLIELNKILQVNSDNQIALKLMCISLLEEESTLQINVSDSLNLSKVIKLLNRLNQITYYLHKDIEDIKEQIYNKFEQIQDADEIINTFTILELNTSEKLFAYSILCQKFYNILGNILIQNDQWEETHKIVNEMLQIDQKSILTRELQVQCLFKQEKFIESYILFDQVLNDFADLEGENFCSFLKVVNIMEFLEKKKNAENVTEFQKRNPQSLVAIFLTKSDEKEVLKEKLKINPNHLLYESFNVFILKEQQKYKELIQSNIQSLMVLQMMIIEDLGKIKDEIERDIDGENVIEYFDKLNPNGQQNKLLEIIKSIILIEKCNQQESLMQLQKIISFDELNSNKENDYSFLKIFKIFSDRFLQSETKVQIETMIKQNLENDPENLVLQFLDVCIKLECNFY